VARVHNNAERHRYEIEVDGELAGFAQYRERPGRISFVHTEIGERFEGRGLAGELIAFALDDAREREREVLPFCPFVNSYIQGHSEYLDLVPEGERARFGL